METKKEFGELTINDYAVIGMAIKNFTGIEACLSDVGAAIDVGISADSPDNMIAAMSNLYLKLRTLQNEVGVFIDDVLEYIDAVSKPVSKSEETESE